MRSESDTHATECDYYASDHVKCVCVSVLTEAKSFGDLQKHAEDHTEGSRRVRQEIPQRLGQR